MVQRDKEGLEERKDAIESVWNVALTKQDTFGP